MYSCSLIIAFYNKIEYLKLVLAGLERQTFKDFEVIIADDGSNEEVVKELENIVKNSSLKINHIWHEDMGWRKNIILNKAVLASNSDYLIFIDGDCVPHKQFIKEHFDYKEKDACITGRRVNLSKKITSMLTPENVRKGWLENNFLLMLYYSFFRESNIEKGIYIKNKFLQSLFNKRKRGILGCNFSLYKEKLLSINGFDERYRNPGNGEDSDVQFRLELINADIKPLNLVAVQYHLFHKELPRSKDVFELFDKVKSEKIAFTNYGIKN